MKGWVRLLPAGLVVLAALILNQAVGNDLWRWYSLIGVPVFIALVVAVRHFDWPVPWTSATLIGLGTTMHYIGGSLGFLDAFPQPNGLYAEYPWWDDVVHAINTMALCAAAAPVVARRWHGNAGAGIFITICIGAMGGVLIEVYEFAHFFFLDTVDQGYYTNTMMDFINNTWGGIIGALIGWPWRRLHDQGQSRPLSP